MTIFHCQSGDKYGLYIVAKDRNTARKMYSAEMQEPYRQVRCQTIATEVSADEQIIDIGSHLLAEYGIEYEIEE